MSTWITREKMAPRTRDQVIAMRQERQRILKLLPESGHSGTNLRVFYRDRPITYLAAKCLANEARRHDHPKRVKRP